MLFYPKQLLSIFPAPPGHGPNYTEFNMVHSLGGRKVRGRQAERKREKVRGQVSAAVEARCCTLNAPQKTKVPT